MTNDLLAKRVDLQNLINKKLIKAYASQSMIENIIESLPEKEKLLMRLSYIKGLSWENICREMNYGGNRIHHIHRQALIIIYSK